MQENVTWFLSASATQTSSSYRVIFLHRYIYVGLLIEYPTSSLRLRSYTPYVQTVVPTRSGAIKDPAPKLVGLAFTPRSKFPPSLSNRKVVSGTATKHVTGLEITTPPSPRSWGSSLAPGLSAGALGCWVLWVGSGQKQGGQSQDAARAALWWTYSCLFISIFSSTKFSFYGQTGKVSLLLFEIHNQIHRWPSLTWMLASGYAFSRWRNHADIQPHRATV